MDINQRLTEELNVKRWQIDAAVQLIDEGNTIPFISRYRKEATGELNDEQLRKLYERLVYLRDSMSCKLCNRFLELIIHLIDRLCLRIFCLRSNLSFSHCCLPDPGSVNCLIRNAFRNDITRSADCVLCTFHTFFFRNICFCRLLKPHWATPCRWRRATTT